LILIKKKQQEKKMNLIKILSIVLLPASLLAFSSGPPNALTGAPGEGNCTQCHSSFPLNSGDGILNIELAGSSEFTPGETYEMTISLENAGQQRWGFELTDLGEGELAVLDSDLTQLSDSGPYLKQTGSGTYNGTADGPVSWSFSWTAPNDAPDEITFYAAGNAADGSGTAGDYIYTTSLTLSNAEVGIDDRINPVDFALLSNYPNPFNPTTQVVFELKQSGLVKLEIFNMLGQQLTTLAEGNYAAGSHSLTWNADFNSQNLTSAVYLAVLTTSDGVLTNRMLLLR
jgi:hypothetical protein